MVVVLCIVGLIAGISFPALSAGLESVRMVSATDSVATFLNSAVNRAERRQQAIALVIQPKEGTLVLYSNEPGFKKQLNLPDGVFIEAVQPVTDADPREPRRFLFLPGATIPGIGIQLSNHHNAHRLVHLDPMTGFPRVESVVTP
jgi:type II secretory pathway pseudopilin PulG